ncbi:agmatine deiminase family protein [Desulfococcaceae bacterium HSG8]|nr:agmatine deiminase family protein [Desulfococcaceae bacterium HSG8]
MKKKYFLIAALSFIFSVSAAQAFVGDINDDGAVDLKDTILAVQICSGSSPAGVYEEAYEKADVNEDGRIGVGEAVYTLQIISRLRMSNVISDDRMLLVLSAPSVDDTYYESAFQLIVDFQISYAKAIIGHDNVVVIVNADTKSYYENELPEDVLITADVYDIWMRDFTTVNPSDPVQFRYTWASMTQQESVEVQGSFKTFADKYGIQRDTTELLLDGGNIVDNYDGKVITTTRFMEDNTLADSDARQQLKTLLNATEVAILEPDEEVLAHSDGMVMWSDKDTLLVNDYSDDADFRTSVMNELETSFTDTAIIEVPVQYSENAPGQWEGFESACGVNLNSVLTFRNIYVPVFGMSHDQDAVDIIRQNTDRNVITVNAENVCPMGGSVRCLTWQLTGQNAEKLISAAREEGDDEFTLSSIAISDGEISDAYKCETKVNGVEDSIPLSWSNVPDSTGSLAVIMHSYPHPDDTSSVNSYLLLWDIDPSVTGMAHGEADDGSWFMGANKDGVAVSYTSPCSPGAGTHEYTITLYALSQTPESLPDESTADVDYSVLKAAIDTVTTLGTATLTFTDVTE